MDTREPHAVARLERFVAAQRDIYPQVVAELAAGEKRSHWIWFIFPQLAGLGRSPTAQRFGLAGLEEAQAYLAHPLLSQRLRECTELMIDWSGWRSADAILGQLDAAKFRSSMTLFEQAAADQEGKLYAHALDAFFGGSHDQRTLHLLDMVKDQPPQAR